MATTTTKDGTEIYYQDWGKGQPIVFSHGWPLSADDWDTQMDDQIVPYVAAGPLLAKLLRNSTFQSYKGFPHGMPTTEAGTINADLLAFLKGAATRAAV